MERKFVAVTFGDIRGFRTWIRRGINSPDVRDPFILCFYSKIKSFTKKHAITYTKYLGDGFLIVKELPLKGNRVHVILAHMQALRELNHTIQKMIRRCSFTPPHGFRLRMAVGYVSKFVVSDPNDNTRDISEFVGYIVNYTQNLLSIAPEIQIMFSQTSVDLLGETKRKIKLHRFKAKVRRSPGVDSEDIERLWICEP